MLGKGGFTRIQTQISGKPGSLTATAQSQHAQCKGLRVLQWEHTPAEAITALPEIEMCFLFQMNPLQM